MSEEINQAVKNLILPVS